MSWDKTYSHQFLLSLDLFGAGVIFNISGITISTLSEMVRDGKEGPLELKEWQRSFLRWLQPRLGRAHATAARLSDRNRAQFVLDSTNSQ